MNNIKIYNKCKIDLLLGYQLQKTNSSYTVGKSLSASSSIGDRTNQEDSVIILEHPGNENIKLLAVADGVGGQEGSEMASSYALQQLTMKFELLPAIHYKDAKNIKDYFTKAIDRINNEIIRNNYGATTLSMAIITNKNTAIFNVGDSRIYTYNKNKLNQETRDDSLVQELFEIGDIPEKDMMRFHKQSNIITQCLGQKHIEINTKIIPNKYNYLLGTTDGITDFLSDEEINEILTNEEESSVSNEITTKAVKTISRNAKVVFKREEYFYEKNIHDNATIAVYKKNNNK